MKCYFLISAFIFLTGCVQLVPKYDQVMLESGELAQIVGTNWRDNHEYMAWILRVYDSKGNIVADRRSGSAIEYLQIREGRYVIVVECHRGNRYAYPAISYQIERSKSYSISCVASKRNVTFVGEEDVEVVAIIKEF